MSYRALLAVVALLCACGRAGDLPDEVVAAVDEPPDGDPSGTDPTVPGDGLGNSNGNGNGNTTQPPEEDPPLRFTAVTFNVGTTDGLAHNANKNDGYTDQEAQISDDWYGNGLAFRLAVAGVREFFRTRKPELVAFQEIFWSGECPAIPSQFHPGFVCEGWSEGDPTVANTVLGPDYQVACHLGNADKCLAVHRDFGTFRGCDDELCLDFLDGARIEDCGGGSRVGRAVVELTNGQTFTVVSVHGTSGVLPSDQICRRKQIEQIFSNLDGEPAANGERNVILGDFNTDPGRNSLFDVSARDWNAWVGDDDGFCFITDAAGDATPTYSGLFNIDHVVSDRFEGECEHPGITSLPRVLEFIYHDHVPAVCELVERE